MTEYPFFSDEEVQEARRYPVIVEWSEADQLYLARVPDMEGLTVHGSTPEEAVASATESALEWLHGMRAIGPENDRWLTRLLLEVDYEQQVVAAWGDFETYGRANAVLRLLQTHADVYCFGVTKRGNPKHPCRLPHDTPLQRLCKRGSLG